ncbi:hypothetical protein CU098_009687 [Rhizopus stolonifer]|uniref:RING-type domain-containing protein n=1 Tax=Rhizopus stolonifer TaxID=4846 RepID=A0A367KM73_RHIST|nr:hypothetical protein CU098_009687 [Rhizopus stolonifer]
MCIRAFIFGFTVLGFAGVHCSYILRNETTLEHMADRPYDVRVDFDTSGYNFEIVSVGPENYLFEQSKKDNWRSVMGDSPLSWFGYGVLHLYRDRLPIQEQNLPDTEIAKQESSQHDNGYGRIICILAVPSYMTNKDFIQFLGPANKDVLQYRFIRRSAFACYEKYNGRRFNMMEPEISHAVYLESNKIDTYSIPRESFPYMEDTLSQDLDRTERSLAELPTCPVCLERMDEITTGLLAIQCRHTVQCDCINKWGHGKCLVCKYSQRPLTKSLLKNNMALKNEVEEKEKILERLSLQVKDLMQVLEN